MIYRELSANDVLGGKTIAAAVLEVIGNRLSQDRGNASLGH